jgi:hypothetical protein
MISLWKSSFLAVFDVTNANQMMQKKCADCGESKPLDSFYQTWKKLGYMSICKKCHIVRMTKRRETNWPKEYEQVKERRKTPGYRKREYKRTAERFMEQYRGDEQFRSQYLQTLKEQYRDDLEIRLRKIVRSRLRMALKGKAKLASAVSLLGVPPEEALRIIESKFLAGMTWDNWGHTRGNWHLDHITPLSKFELSDPAQLAAACHISNLQPLWAEDNWHKHAKMGHF